MFSNHSNRRREKRLRYNWPIWFAEDFNGQLNQGQMIDISSTGAAFTCYADKCPNHGQDITARFSIPNYNDQQSFDVDSFIRSGYVCRIEEVGPFVRRVAVKFAEPLPIQPGEQNSAIEIKDHKFVMA